MAAVKYPDIKYRLDVLYRISNTKRTNSSKEVQWACKEPSPWSHGRRPLTHPSHGLGCLACHLATRRAAKLPVLGSNGKRTFRNGMSFESGSILLPESYDVIKDVNCLLVVKGKVFAVVNHWQQERLGRHWAQGKTQSSTVCKTLFLAVKFRPWLQRISLFRCLVCVLQKIWWVDFLPYSEGNGLTRAVA